MLFRKLCQFNIHIIDPVPFDIEIIYFVKTWINRVCVCLSTSILFILNSKIYRKSMLRYLIRICILFRCHSGDFPLQIAGHK